MCFHKYQTNIEKSTTISDDEFLEEFMYDFPLLPEWMFEENNDNTDNIINPLEYSNEIDGTDDCNCGLEMSHEELVDVDIEINILLQLPHDVCEEHNCPLHTFGFDRDHILPPWFVDVLALMAM